MVLLSELENSLFGLTLEAGASKEIDFKSERMVNITMAALDVKKKCDEYVPVVVKTSETSSYVICTLSKDRVMQQQLQLMINAGENVKFTLNAEHGCVNLTGYYLQDDNMMPLEEEDDERSDRIAKANQELAEYMYGGGEDDSDMGSEEDEDDDEDDDDEDDDEEEDDDEDEEEEDEDEEVEQNGKRKMNGADKKNGKNQKTEEKPPKLVPEKKEADVKKLAGGVTVKDLKEGKGPEAKKGKYIHVYYTGRLKQNGKQFDACQSGKPFKFRLGSGEVIKGWDIGFENMKVGGKRQIVVPPNMGYGNKRMGNDIPANSTLIFDVELKAVS
ncbi:unnamed protein product [Brachionus calyciflorus]|uniref:peptidylprolyl isomerase n=1 Tax=Brachionus calyciflorus TaxID=104777 RepID=A0A814DTS9_9BILA|nr:unnamed protein product [Brachionus calyciflorus]